jgi:hypothetical protein
MKKPPKKKGRKRVSQKAGAIANVPTALPSASRRRWVTSPLAVLTAVVGAVASAIAVWDAYWLTIPEIRGLGPNAGVPFDLPFAVKNPSRLFTMNNVEFRCYLDVEFANKSSIKNIYVIAARDRGKDIGPGDTRNYRCPLTVPAGGLVKGRINLRTTYSTMIFHRASPDAPFNWSANANPPRWIEGEM